ncbi:hypothetical protein ACP70R_025166 [Stipagrostis hirtigluma subsp. patula]
MDRVFFSRNRKRNNGVGAERKRGNGRRAAQKRARKGPDLISGLPDDVLGAIVTLLDTAEGARTAALSRRWRYVWRSAPLNLDDRFEEPAIYFSDERVQVISRILASHPAPARRLAVRSVDLGSYSSAFDGWFRLPVLDSLQELFLDFTRTHSLSELPASALRFASLRVLDVDDCSFPAACTPPAFPCLTRLSLRHVGVTEELLHGIISGSPRIEALVLDTNSGYRRLRLSLPKLRYLAVSNRSFRKRIELKDLVLEDAASLERLLLHEVGYGPSVRITGAAKLRMLGYLGNGFPSLQLGNTIFKSTVPVSFVEQFTTVKILALEMAEWLKLKVVISYLRCFPCLEKLKIKFSQSGWNTYLEGAVPSDPYAPIECLDRSLKTIMLQSYSGQKPHAEFAKFFVESARVLEVMKFYTTEEVTRKWLEEQCRRLNIENRASRCVRFPFMLERELPLRFWMDDGFSSDDPFEDSM